MSKKGQYARSVSIIGVGCTPFMNTVDKPETASQKTSFSDMQHLVQWRMQESGQLTWIIISMDRHLRLPDPTSLHLISTVVTGSE